MSSPPAVVRGAPSATDGACADHGLNSSITSFLFPVFASYKALKTSDPAQLTPWLMYWVVFSCCLLVESWFSFVLFWCVANKPRASIYRLLPSLTLVHRIPFYSYIRLFFLLYLILPQTQGARIIYEEKIHPFLEDNEANIDGFIASTHERLKAAGMTYVRQALEYVKTNVLGLPPTEQPPAYEPASAQGYTQSLLARFSVPTTRWTGSTGSEFYSFVANAVSAAASAGTAGARGSADRSIPHETLIPPNLRNSADKMNYIDAQRERLNIVLSALDREAHEVQRSDAVRPQDDGVPDATQRPLSGLSGWSGLSKSRSETDFETVEADSGAEEDLNLRRRKASGSASRKPWSFWGSGSGSDAGSGAGSGAAQEK